MSFKDRWIVQYGLAALTKEGMRRAARARQTRDNLESLVQERTRDLRESEDRLRALYRTMSEGLANHEIVFRDGEAVDYVITDVNPAYENITGLTRSNVIGRKASEVYGTGSPPFLDVYARVASGGAPENFEIYFPPMEKYFRISVFSPGKGKFATVFSDITELKKTEEALLDLAVQKEASRYARSLIEVSIDPLVTISSLGKITDVNEATVKATGVPREALIGTDFSGYFTEPKMAERGYQRVFAQGFVTDYPLTIRHRDGHLTDVLYNASLYRDSHGNVLGVFAAARDVTVQKQAFQYARSLIEASLDPLVTISPQGKITDANEATIRATGVPREELIGTDFSNYFTEPEKAEQGYQLVLARGFVTDYSLTVRRRDGHLTDVLYNASLYRDTHGNIMGIFAAARDVTVQKQAELELKRHKENLELLVKERTAELGASNKELERSNENLQQFAYVASHDLQEPLRTMSSYSQLIEKRYKTRLDQDADEFIGYIVGAAARMQELITDLLAYSRAGHKTTDMSRVDCSVIVRRVVESMAATIGSAGGDVTFDALPSILAHESNIIQLFQNLIGNALKFRGENPPRVHVSAQKVNNEWVFSVRDNGIGIEAQYSTRIFMIFQRLHPREKYTGTGIGLSICKRIVENLGGRIWVESEPNEGSTFYFTVPIERENMTERGIND